MSKHRLTRGSVRRSLALAATGAMVFALSPVQSAFATHGPDEGARDINEAGDVCEGRDRGEFDDIASERTDEAAECLNDLGIAYGFVDGDYRPTNAITREQMASFLYRKLQSAVEFQTDENYPPAPYLDRAKIADAHINSVDAVTAEGIAEGRNDGRYAPGEPVTRAQMAAFIVREMEAIISEARGEDVTLAAEANHFTDDEGNWAEEEINILADHGIVEGDAQGNYNPSAEVTRGQMALFIARNVDALNNEYGITFESIREEPAAPTNQAFTVTEGGERVVLAEGESRDFTFADVDAETVDIRLFACDNVTTTDGIVTFEEATGTDAGHAAPGTVDDTIISEVDGVVTATTRVDEHTVTGNTVSVSIQHDGTGRECVVVVIWDDADEDDRLDVNAEGEPTEDFAVSGETEFANITALDATPETDTNRFGTQHTVTAQLQVGAGNDVDAAGETVRFQVIRGATDCDPAGDAIPATGTVITTGTATTDESGQATFSYTVADPSAAEGNEVDDCIVVWHDANNNGVRENTEPHDVVAKFWRDVPGATTLDAEPELDSNPVGTAHTVTATVTNQFGEPVSGESVRFEIYRDTTGDENADTNPVNVTRTTATDGTASVSYVGPGDAATDVIVVCLDDTTCGVVSATAPLDTIEGDADADPDADGVRKHWVEAAATDTTEEAVGDEVVGFDTTADFIDTDENLRYSYNTGDQFFVACSATPGTFSPVTYAQFEAALSTGDLLTTANYDPDEVSQFSLVDEDDSGTTCP